MKISTGISEIGFNNLYANRTASEKFYIWPVYNAGHVDRIHGVARRTESNAVYSMPVAEDREKILAHVNDFTNREYSSSGKINRSYPAVQPGSLFDAIV